MRPSPATIASVDRSVDGWGKTFTGVCEGGVSCTGNRDLFDDFGVAASPATGMASIIYSDDQYTNDANNPPQVGCTPARSNTGACDHTAVATQTSGPGIYTVVR